jgi:hypothetical protein
MSISASLEARALSKLDLSCALPVFRARAEFGTWRYIGTMSRAGILLRVVLSLSLVLNGIGGLLAATEMALGPAATAHETASAATPAATHSGCHDHASMPHHQQPSPEPAGKLPAGHSDCCGVGLCGCACAQLPSLAALELLFVPPNLEHERLSDAVDANRPSPALPHLIRPPIV